MMTSTDADAGGASAPDSPSPSASVPEAGGKPRRMWRRFSLYMLASASTGILLGLSFPPAMIWPLAFTALVPWLLVLPRLGLGGTILSTFLVGGFWFGFNLGWLGHLAPVAFPVVAVVLSLHLMLFSIPAHYLLRRGRWWGLAGTGAMWILFETLRMRLDVPLPFPWLMLGDSQAAFLPVAQIAELGGVTLVSALVVTINLALARPLLLKRKRRAGREDSAADDGVPDSKTLARRTFVSATASLALLFVALVYGFVRLEQLRPEGEALVEGPKIAVTQPNRVHRVEREGPRPSALRLSLEQVPQAYASQADLIVWSEAIFSGMRERGVIGAEDPLTPSDEEALEELLRFAVWPRVEKAIQEAQRHRAKQLGEEIPPEALEAPVVPADRPRGWPYFLLGTTFETTIPAPYLEEDNGVYDRTSAHFLDPEGELLGLYHKQELVPMGEHVPFVELDFVAKMVQQGFEAQGLGSYLPMSKPGDEAVHFALDVERLEHSETPPNPFAEDGRYTFAVPICYELAFPHTVRRLVTGPEEAQRPADLLVNLSDESWYGRSPELMQMLQMGTMRAIENRRSIVRCTNTGISAFIAPSGMMYAIIEDEQGRVIEVGPAVLAERAFVTDVRTPYQRLGDWVPVLALLVAVASFALLIVARRQERAERRSAAAETS